jgi:hypothetical protein
MEAARAVGLEWLGEEIGGEADEEEDKAVAEDEDPNTPLYVTMPTLAGLQKVLSLWRRYVSGEARPKTDGVWWKIFGYLRDVRPWSARDRVEPSVAPFIVRMRKKNPQQPIRLELDLWFRADAELRASAETYIREMMGLVGGKVLDFLTVEPIHYQAALIELPVEQAIMLGDLGGPLADADRVMRVRPQSLFAAEPAQVDDAARSPSSATQTPTGLPIAALLDGYPVYDHAKLAGRVIVKESEVQSADVPAARRFHGTAMASLIVGGDLGDTDAQPLSRPIVSVPVLTAPPGLSDECTPLDKLPIGVMLRAVESLIADRGVGVDGRRIVVINHSICDREAPFSRRASPWAKLLDHLAHVHTLLFVVSAGNCHEAFPLDTYEDCSEFEAADPVQRQIVLLRGVERSKGARVILSPAESINAITVGAIHEDASQGCPDGHIDPFSPVGVANLGSTLGFGWNRGLKPDLVEQGGRQLVRTLTENGVVSAYAVQHPDVGQLTAMPDPTGVREDKLGRSTGTSNAAALTTRSGVRLGESLERLYAEDGEDWAATATRAVTLKALLAHGCRWGETGAVLEAVYGPDWRKQRAATARFLGYGRPDLTRLLSQDGSRITLLADDLIQHDGRHEYKIPVPRAMLANNELRRITLTLAWSAPIDPVSQRYRGFRAELVDRDGKRNFWDGVKKISQPDVWAGRRGALQHMILEGTKKVAAVAEGGLFVGVQGFAELKPFVKTEVPYALAVTLEMGAPVRQDLYEDVRTRVRPKTRVQQPIATRVRT